MKAHPSGPAFPNITPDMPVDGHPGMTLRDYFAAKAMQAEITTTAGASRPDPADVAAFAYEVADAMLAILENQS